jgi:hypothetical protein
MQNGIFDSGILMGGDIQAKISEVQVRAQISPTNTKDFNLMLMAGQYPVKKWSNLTPTVV